MSDIYTKIFNISNENMRKAGLEPEYSLETLQWLLKDNPHTADMLEMSYEDDCRIFVEKCYISLMKKLPTDGMYDKWEDKFSLPKAEFQYQLVNTLMDSKEFAGKNVKVYNNIYSKKTAYGKAVANLVEPSKKPENK